MGARSLTAVAKDEGVRATLISSKWIAFCAVAATISVTAACSSHEPKPALKSAAAGHPSTSATSSSADQARQAALAAYTGMWADAASAARTADWKDSVLAHHATDHALGELVTILYREQGQGLVSRGAPVLHAQVVQVAPIAAPTAVMIEDCADTSSWPEVDPKTGNPPAGAVLDGRRLVRARVALAEQVWRVTDLAVFKTGSCS